MSSYKTWLKNFFFIFNSLSMNFIMLINVKMPTIVGILTFISMLNTFENLKHEKFNFQYFSFYGKLKFQAHLG